MCARPSPRPEAATAPSAPRPTESEIVHQVDRYFLRSKQTVQRFGDKRVTYAIFMRRPVVFCPQLAVDWIQSIAAARGVRFEIELLHKEGEWVGAGDPMMYVTGSLMHLLDLETTYLQKLGPACVAAYNAYTMCVDLPKVAFLAMDARHCAGGEMAEMMAYAASVGSAAAKRELGAVGFIGSSTDSASRFFGQTIGKGTMPHAFIGYAGSTVRAAEMMVEAFPGDDLTVLVDYYGKEITDSLEVCRRFPDLAAAGRLGVRLDTHGGRYLEGLDLASSYAVLERNAPLAIRGYRTEGELKHLVGTGVSAAAIWHTRRTLDEAGFPKVKIVASSGFTPAKCKTMAVANVPVDVIGTGSYLPEIWTETYATSDIIDYDGRASVKVGREFLLRKPSG